MTQINSGMDRRAFLQAGMLAGVAAGIPAMAAEGEKAADKPDPKKILNYKEGMNYRRMGNTDAFVSVIAMGGLKCNPDLNNYAIDQGVNLFHMSNSYLNGNSIVKLGEIMKTRRDEVYLALKDNFFGMDDYRQNNLGKIDDILKLLNTDHVDFFMFNIHNPQDAADPIIKETLEKLKASGKVRFGCGLTIHDKVPETFEAGVKSGMYDMINPALPLTALELFQEGLKAAADKKVSVMPMKSMNGVKDLDNELAYYKKLLKSPGITTVVKGFDEFEKFDAYVAAQKETLTSMEDRKLYRYAHANRSSTCMMCSECKGVCPLGVEISTVIRCKEYYYGQEKDWETALATYRELPVEKRGSEECRLCTKCEGACPNGLQIVERLIQARQLFA